MSKTIAYDYCFNCADIPYNDEIIDGTSVMISFVAYNALFKEINLSDAMRTVEGYGISDLIKVSFDNENEYTIQCRQKVLDAFYRDYGFLSLHCKPIGYSLCVKLRKATVRTCQLPKKYIEVLFLKIKNFLIYPTTELLKRLHI